MSQINIVRRRDDAMMQLKEQSFSNEDSNFDKMDGVNRINIVETKGTVLLMRTKTVHPMLDLVEINLKFQLADPVKSVYFRKQKSNAITPLKLHRFKVNAIFDLIQKFVIDDKKRSKEIICLTLSLLFDPTKEPLTFENQVSELSLKLLNQVLKEYCKCIEVDDVVTLTAKIYSETDFRNYLNHNNHTETSNIAREVSAMSMEFIEQTLKPPATNYAWPDFSVPPPTLMPYIHQQHPHFYAPMTPQMNPALHLFSNLHNYPVQPPLSQTYHQHNPPWFWSQDAHHSISNGNCSFNNNN
jgi:hypothetical protein